MEAEDVGFVRCVSRQVGELEAAVGALLVQCEFRYLLEISRTLKYPRGPENFQGPWIISGPVNFQGA